MKDTIITTRRKRIELWTLLTCFLIGNLANLYAIISYKTPFSEMLTSIFYVLAFSCVLYVFLDLVAAFVLRDTVVAFEESKINMKNS